MTFSFLNSEELSFYFWNYLCVYSFTPFFILCLCTHVCECHGMSQEANGELSVVGSLLPPVSARDQRQVASVSTSTSTCLLITPTKITVLRKHLFQLLLMEPETIKYKRKIKWKPWLPVGFQSKKRSRHSHIFWSYLIPCEHIGFLLWIIMILSMYIFVCLCELHPSLHIDFLMPAELIKRKRPSKTRF